MDSFVVDRVKDLRAFLGHVSLTYERFSDDELHRVEVLLDQLNEFLED